MNTTGKKIKLSIDDGCASDVRLAKLAEKYEIETIFYWPVEMVSLALYKGYKPLTFFEARDIAKSHEIGSHTITHRHLTKISDIEAREEIYYSKFLLEDMFGVKVKKFAPPRGYTTEELTNYTLDHYEEQRLTKGSYLVHIHPSSGANNNVDWVDAINENTTEIWGHGWEIDKYDEWGRLEEVLSAITHSKSLA